MSLRIVSACFLGLLVSASSFAKSTVPDLVRRIPPSANALVAIDLNALFRTPMAVNAGWRDAFEQGTSGTPLMVPRSATAVVIGGRVDLELFKSEWEVGLATLSKPISIDMIVAKEGGYADEIAGIPVAWMSTNAYAVAFGASELAVVSGSDRQYVARWIRSYAEPGSSGASGRDLPKPLSEVSALSIKAPIVFALDLRDIVSPFEARTYLGSCGVDFGDDADLNELGEALASVQALVFTVQIGEEATGVVEITFGKGVSSLGRNAKKVMMSIADAVGASVPDSIGWVAEIDGNTCRISGPMSEVGIEAVLSVMEAPMPREAADRADSGGKPGGTSPDQASPNDAGQGGSESETIEATRVYLDELSEMVDRLGVSAGKNPSTASTWIDRAVTKIRRLDSMNVDPAAVELGAEIGMHLREATRELQLARQRAMTASSRQTYTAHRTRGLSQGGSSAYSSSRKNRIDQQREAAKMQEMSRGMQKANKVFSEIDSAMIETRRALMDKYGVAF